MNYLVKCKFCPKLNLDYSCQVSEYLNGLVPKKRPCDLYCCLACKSNFFYERERLVGWSFGIRYKGASWTTVWFEENVKTLLYKDWKIITEFSTGTPLTPHNLAEKLPTILTFL
jgi:hypothetical protein